MRGTLGLEENEEEESVRDEQEEEKTSDRSTVLGRKIFQRHLEDFDCENCGHLEQGDGYTNHCSRCLWCKHVDIHPGDRAAECQGMMKPVAVDTKKGNYRILQRCIDCDHERWNKRQEKDDFQALLDVSALQAEEKVRVRGGGGRASKVGGRGGGDSDRRRGRDRGKKGDKAGKRRH